MEDKTIWRCTLCGKDGRIDHPFEESIAAVIEKIVNSHEQVSPLCVQPFGKLQIAWGNV